MGVRIKGCRRCLSVSAGMDDSALAFCGEEAPVWQVGRRGVGFLCQRHHHSWFLAGTIVSVFPNSEVFGVFSRPGPGLIHSGRALARVQVLQ